MVRREQIIWRLKVNKLECRPIEQEVKIGQSLTDYGYGKYIN